MLQPIGEIVLAMKKTNDLAFVVANMRMIQPSSIINNASEILLAYTRKYVFHL